MSATKSDKTTSGSWPTALIIGILLSLIACNNTSSLKAQRSS
ncbi:hypothetical protein Mccp14020TZ_00720 [Mycoplasma capricolum subsp. capripneumoniae]|nr:hypothetical protein Mccp14020TZ_00720 [Mycoplasma capricolum subsp. capripneumoniae]